MATNFERSQLVQASLKLTNERNALRRFIHRADTEPGFAMQTEQDAAERKLKEVERRLQAIDSDLDALEHFPNDTSVILSGELKKKSVRPDGLNKYGRVP